MRAAADTPDYRAIAKQLAERYQLPFFPAQIQQESGYNPNAVSPAGAQGIAQIMPATAQGWGVNPNDPVASLQAAAEHMRGYMDKYGNDPKMALAAYNMGEANLAKYGPTGLPETANYIQTILGSGASLQSPQTTTGGPVAPFSFGSRTPLPTDSLLPSLDLPSLTSRSDDMLQSIISGHGLNTWDMINQPSSISSTLSKPLDFTNTDSMLSQLLNNRNGTSPNTTLPYTGQQGTDQTLPYKPGSDKNVTISATADRKGVPIQQPVVDFVSRVASVYGSPLTIGTGTNHNQYVKGTTRESAHWTGGAADIPKSGPELTRLGQDALIAAGMPAAEARKQTGGLFNIGNWQVIFNSNEGGNHFNHLHVGRRGGAG